MSNLKSIPLPRAPQGVLHGDVFVSWMHAYTREILARLDPRNPTNDYAAGMVANQNGSVTLGQEAYPDGRTASVPTLVTNLDNAGRAASPDLVWPVYTANRNSVQDIDTVLIATSDETGSKIEVQAHSVKWEDKTVAYSSGTITGLDAETVYFVYCIDADRDGGLVSYFATTNPDNLIQKGAIYTGNVTTPVTSSAQNIIAATSANPIVITTDDDHGWSSGNSVAFASMPGAFAVLNGNSYAITRTAADKFLLPVNGSAFAAYAGPAGTATRVSGSNESGGGAGAGVGGGRFDLVVIP